MENGGSMFISNHSNDDRQQNGSNNSNNHAWESMWALNHSRFDLGNSSGCLYTSVNTAAETADATTQEGNTAHALLFSHSLHHHQRHNQSLYVGDGSNLHPDPHLMCLKLGKRHYFEDATAPPLGDRHVAGLSNVVKKGKPYNSLGGGGGVGPSSSPAVATSTAAVPRCQVEGCHVALINAKDYHRRHKVCEMHSKAPKVVVLGLEQRFCQQCSRFHVVSEFDDSKRSCRRRLAGHNERRRKSSHDSLSRNSSQANKLMTGGTFRSPTGRALSLLSSKPNAWVSTSDLSSRCSAALHELIAENRATVLARHLIIDRDWHLHHAVDQDPGDPQAGLMSMANNLNHHQLFTQPHNWGRYHETGTHVTLDLMQAPTGEFGFFSTRGKIKDEEEVEEDCSEFWNSFAGAHVV